MCGITGIWHLDGEKINSEKLERFTDAIRERGPDGFGYAYFNNNTLGLGHRRLSILDLSEAGKQPMHFGEGRYTITYNGEVYNFRELKAELEKLNYQFKTETDTEVILASYHKWGKECLHKFNGMWAFAIWDAERHELFLARDRFGVKPLYYVFIPDKIFAFASETRAFKCLDGFSRQIDEINFQKNSEDPQLLEGLGETIFQQIYQLLPGHYAIKKPDNLVHQKRWWDIREKKIHVSNNFNEQTEQFYTLFHNACKQRLISDVPIATALSGGLDSTSVFCTVNDILRLEKNTRVHPDSQRAFIASFPGLISDELEYALKAVNYVKGNCIVLKQTGENLANQIERDTRMLDSIHYTPITAVSQIYKGMKENGISVSLDGHGVDEMMYGYLEMIFCLYQNKLFNEGVKSATEYRSIIELMNHPDYLAKAKLNLDQKENEYTLAQKGVKGRIKQSVKKIINKRFKEGYFQEFKNNLSNKPYNFNSLSTENRMVYYEFFMHTLPALLKNFDRAGMMNSVEIRMPFMDWELVQFVFSLPVESKVGGGFTKRILREAMKDKIPDEIRTRTYKVGVGDPLFQWIDLYLGDWFKDSLASIQTVTAKNIAQKFGNNSKINVSDVQIGWLQINRKLIE
jgi:asparagine synthase (glutamine-hydrolysing)